MDQGKIANMIKHIKPIVQALLTHVGEACARLAQISISGDQAQDLVSACRQALELPDDINIKVFSPEDLSSSDPTLFVHLADPAEPLEDPAWWQQWSLAPSSPGLVVVGITDRHVLAAAHVGLLATSQCFPLPSKSRISPHMTI